MHKSIELALASSLISSFRVISNLRDESGTERLCFAWTDETMDGEE